MTEIVIAVAGKVSEYLVAPIGRQLGYMFCFRSHTDELRDKIQTLVTARNDLQISVDEARRRGHEIRPIVEEWLNRVDQTTGEAEKLMIMTDQNKSCFNLKSHYQLGREAYKKAQVIVKIQEARNFRDGISYHVPPRTVTFKGYESCASRDSTLSKIMDALRDEKKTMIGVWGMGGVGKTTLLKQVAEQAKQLNLFTTQVYIDVSWTRDDVQIKEGILKIQQQIAEKLGLELRETTPPARADKLMPRLKTENILIVLDDFWKAVNMEEVGIPCCSKDCKIVLAARDEDILRKDMGAGERYQIKHLDEEEAWELFKKTAGDSVEGDQLRSTAMEVAKECQGLPVAIVTIANALKDESVGVWKNALDELKNSAPTNIRGVDEKVYGCLKLSYNHLKSDEAKSLFLLCGSLRSYGHISMCDLLRYALGLDFFDRINSLQQASNKLVALVRILKASSLLLDGEDDRGYCWGTTFCSTLIFTDGDDNKSVRMHDLVRDVARAIASGEPHRYLVGEDVGLEDWSETDDKYKRCTLISLDGKDVNKHLPQSLVCPSLKITNSFFNGMNQLKVLDLCGIDFETLPLAFQSLTNLRMLCLDRCLWLVDIAGIGGLKRLQVLSMVGSGIRQLPQEMSQLTNLRLLNLNFCRNLQVIPRDILSNLSGLECLFMRESFTNWASSDKVSDRDQSNASLSELNHLHGLWTIDVCIPDVKLFPKEDEFVGNLTSYTIKTGGFFFGDYNEKSRALCLEGGDGSLLLGSRFRKLLQKTEEVRLRELEEVCCDPIPISSFDKLQILEVQGCIGLKFIFLLSMARDVSQFEFWQEFSELRSLELVDLPNLINFVYFNSELEKTSQGMFPDMPFFHYKVSFPKLEEVTLSGLPQLKEIWHHGLPELDSNFSNLQCLRVKNCPSLLNLIPSNLVLSFMNLKEIEVKKCKVLQHVFDLQGYDYTNVQHVEFLPKLKTLVVNELVGLKGIIKCNNSSSRGLFSPLIPLSFGNLKCLVIYGSWKGVVDIPSEEGVLFDEKVLFPHLEELELNSLSRLTMIWHPILKASDIQSFRNLKEVIVRDCKVLEYVFDHQELDNGDRILPKMESLELQELPKLRGIFRNKDENNNMKCLLSLSKLKDFHHLKKLYVINCGKPLDEEVSFSPTLEELILESFPKLKEIEFGNPQKLEILQLEKLPMLSSIICNEDEKDINKCPFSPSTFKSFTNLKKVIIKDCAMDDSRDVMTPANVVVLPNEKFPFLQSTFDNIMDALRDDEINLIGIVGIDGMGTTQLLKQVAQQAMEQHLFSEQLYFDVSSSDKLQGEVFSDIRLRKRMRSWKKKKILVIVDDICKGIDLEELVIPSCKDDDDDDYGMKWKIVLTCRDEDGEALLCKENKRGAQICFQLKTLPQDEAWTLFKKTVVGADSVVDENIPELLRSIAIQVVQECEGVPMAIVTIAKALKDETAVAVWENALEHLRNSMNCAVAAAAAGDRTKVIYSSCLEWSYTHLKHDDAKSLLLVCASLINKDDSIRMDHLLQYVIGLDLFDRIDSLEQARSRLLALVEMLKASDWLIEGHPTQATGSRLIQDSLDLLFRDDDSKFVRMSDHVVYDVAREIASRDPHPFVVREDVGLEEWSKTDESQRCAFISLYCKNQQLPLPQGLVCPELQTFVLHDIHGDLNIPSTFFLWMKKLQVLDLSHMRFKTLPSSLDSLVNLQTLRLDGCYYLEDIALIGKLTKLEVVSLASSGIRQLPNEMVQLTNLRLLDLNGCRKLEVIPQSILSSFSKLECLLMRKSFAEWGEGESNANPNACLFELNQVHYLTTLEIDIANIKSLPKEIMKFENLKRYEICIGDMLYKRTMKRTNRTLCIMNIDTEDMLEEHEIVHPIPITTLFFGNLKTLHVELCPGLRCLFSLSMARGLCQLENMTIVDCAIMHEVVIVYERELLGDEYDGGEGGIRNNFQLFPNLRTLTLRRLPKFINFVSQFETTSFTCFTHKVLFPKLEELELYDVPNWRDVWNPQHGSFSNLRSLIGAPAFLFVE